MNGPGDGGGGVMRPRTAARTAGVLFLISYLGFGVGTALLAPLRDIGHDLAAIDGERAQVLAGVLGEFVNIAAIIGFAVVLYPYLKRAGEGLALGYVAMRILEGAAYLVAGVSTLSLLTLSEEVGAAGGTASAEYAGLQVLALGQSEWAATLATAPFIVGAALLYVLLLRSRLVPRFISLWGLISVGLLVLSNVLAPDTQNLGPAALLVLPIIANEFFLAGWLIVRGFSPAASAEPATVLAATHRPLLAEGAVR